MTEIMKVGETINAGEKITSLELVKQINVFRSEEGNRAELKHNDLLKVIRDEFDEEIGMGNISHTPYIHPQNGQEYSMFELTLSQAKQVLMRESKFVRKATIAYIDKLEKKLKEIATPQLPQNYLDALKCLVKSEEEKLLLQTTNTELKIENTVMKPKADYFDDLVDKKVNIGVRDYVKELSGVKERSFVQWLLDNKYCYRNKKNKLRPYAEYVDDLFVLKEFVSGNGYGDANMLITPKGRETFRLLFSKTK